MQSALSCSFKGAIKLLAQENPIMDLIATVTPSFLHKYDLPSNATVLPTPRLMPIYQDLLQNFECQLRPAGSAFNTLRACQVAFGFTLACDQRPVSDVHGFHGLHWE